MTEEGIQKAELAAWMGAIGHLGLALLNGAVGYISGSKALVADAVRSTSIAACSFAVLLGARKGKPSSYETAAEGTGKAETGTAVLLSALLVVFGIELGISCIYSFFTGFIQPPEIGALIAAVIAFVTKEAMFRYGCRLGIQRAHQGSMEAGWDYRLHLYVSIAVLLGALGAILGDYLGNNYLYYLDPVAGLFVAAVLLKMGWDITAKSARGRLGSYLQKEDAAELLEAAQKVTGVITVDALKAREQGHYVIVDVSISVNPRISVLEGHDVAKTLRNTLMHKFSHVSDVHVRVNPYDPGYPYKNNVDPHQDTYPTILH
ncbi:cation diffusion facilitator family transporter [Paenibacillus xerothermodurans]|uniref:Cation transporter n=1 Tax=Paenibacillus xerothermodurans TaxID=1977292 RepID=A0A2W1N4Z9_PAEXE|nr:cation diffusion facilitator family transporter [Paenibacillus xerothermodurans]PZE19457.1 cation transporter [Paenibacillus xerothermodurans]